MNHIIDPRLSQDMIDLLDHYEVPHDEGALLWELEKRGFWIYLAGPDESRDGARRWDLRIVGELTTPLSGVVQRNFYGQTARIALTRAFQWVVEETRP